ncbi:MAG: TonB-dependent receptor plug domain-containing protein [Bacteroidetes bacterium]|nr:TonB-dependent receptor plug domain-containing protein [Bacteroidota bacterium]
MKTSTVIFFSILLLVKCPAFSQNLALVPRDTNSFFEMSLEQLMNVEISVASHKALTPRESPGIVSQITEEEIKNSGAQDLMDILKLIPGFDFAVDVQGVVGLGIRGNWAHEGKMLLLIDGQEMNEALYSTLQFGNHYPVEQIRKIEIIRGPGSSIYGGNAEYAVINIITKNDRDFTGVSATASYGRMKETFARKNYSISAGQHFGDLALNVGALIGEGNRSDRQYTDYFGQSVSMGDRQKLNPSFVNAGLSYKEFSLRAIADVYHTTMLDGYDHLYQTSVGNDFNSYYFEAKYKWILSDRFSITPKFNYKQQTPWRYTGDSIEGEYLKFDITSHQPHYNLTCSYDPGEHLNILAGGEYFTDIANNNIEGEFFNNGSRTVEYRNTALFTQLLWSNKIANITIGARFHDNNHYDPSFVPRIGITKVIDKFHAKILFSKAYRAPGIENINFGTGIKPENTTVAEVEAGYEFSNLFFLSANFYDISTLNPIIYYYNEGDAYINHGVSGTRGVEVDFKLKGKGGYVDINYSYYHTRSNSSVMDYSVGENASVFLAFPAHKINFSGSLMLKENISINGTLSWNSDRYAFIDVDPNTGENITQKHNQQFFAGLYLNMKDIFIKNLGAGIGCSNLLDEKENYIQPYNSYHSPLPGASREFRFRLSYEFNFSKK